MYFMTKDDIYFYVQAKKNLEFTFKNKTYLLTYDKDSNGKDVIIFGQLYDGIKYYSFGELMNNAKVENYYFKEFISDL